MSKASSAQPDWLKQNYEKILLVGVLLFLLISAAILALRIGEGRRLIEESGRAVQRSAGQDVQAVDLRGLEEAARQLTQPTQVQPAESRMFSSETRVSCVRCSKPIEFSAQKCPFCGAVQPDAEKEYGQDTDDDKIPDEWEMAHGMDPFVPDDAQYDLDNDGFTALEEYLGKTNPADPNDHPSWVAKLRFDRVVTEPFRFRFVAKQEVKAGDFMFQLNDRVTGQSFFRRIGTEAEGYTLADYKQAEDALVLTRGDRTFTLGRGREIEDGSQTVRFAFLTDRSSPEALLGQVFTLRDVEYKVTELTGAGAKIENVATGESFDVQPMSDADRRHMAGPSGMNIAQPGTELPNPSGGELPLP